MVKIPNPLAFITKPITSTVDRMVADRVRGGVSRAVKDFGGDFLANMTKGIDNIGKFAGNHQKELALGVGAVAALGIAKQIFFPAATPTPPPPPNMAEQVTNFLQDNWKVAAPVAAVVGMAAPMIFQHMTGGGRQGQSQMQQNPQQFMRSMMQGISNIQNGQMAQATGGNPFIDFQPNVDLSDVSGNGHAMAPRANSSNIEDARRYMQHRLGLIQNS